MSHFENRLGSASAQVLISTRNLMTSNHNGSNLEPQYEWTSSNGFQSPEGLGLQTSEIGPIHNQQFDASDSLSKSTTGKPVWDRIRRELRVGDVVVKRFKWPAENQEAILDAFEDNGWPEHLADPLKPHPNISPKRRLHDTIKCLNRKQINEFIKFRGDGTGLGVRLEIVSAQQLCRVINQ